MSYFGSKTYVSSFNVFWCRGVEFNFRKLGENKKREISRYTQGVNFFFGFDDYNICYAFCIFLLKKMAYFLGARDQILYFAVKLPKDSYFRKFVSDFYNCFRLYKYCLWKYESNAYFVKALGH